MRRHLPARTEPPRVPLPRRHQPRPQCDYHQYRPCADWDFSFTCAWCLISLPDVRNAHHESVRRWTFQLDHVLPQKVFPRLASNYSNIVLACSKCNRTKSDLDPSAQTNPQRTLDPTQDAWGDHFALHDGTLAPKTATAAWTAQQVGINDAMKCSLRKARALRITELRATLDEVRLQQARVNPALSRLRDERSPTDDVHASLSTAMQWGEDVVNAAAERLAPWMLPPAGAGSCGCSSAQVLSPWIDQQLLTF